MVHALDSFFILTGPIMTGASPPHHHRPYPAALPKTPGLVVVIHGFVEASDISKRKPQCGMRHRQTRGALECALDAGHHVLARRIVGRPDVKGFDVILVQELAKRIGVWLFSQDMLKKFLWHFLPASAEYPALALMMILPAFKATGAEAASTCDQIQPVRYRPCPSSRAFRSFACRSWD